PRCGRRGRRYPARPLRDGAVVSQAGNDGAPPSALRAPEPDRPAYGAIALWRGPPSPRPRRCPRSEPSTWRARKLAQLALRRRRNEALGNQSMADQIGDPLGILHIGLATRHVPDMPGVADDEVEMPFQHGIDRAPVNAGALHADLRHPKLLQPVPQRFQIARHRPKGPHLLPRPLARGADQDAGNDRLLMHVKPGAPLNDHLHLRLHPKEGDRDAAGIVETLPRVLPVPGGDKKWYLYV